MSISHLFSLFHALFPPIVMNTMIVRFIGVSNAEIFESFLILYLN